MRTITATFNQRWETLMDAEKMANDPTSREQWGSYNHFIAFFKWSTILVIIRPGIDGIFLAVNCRNCGNKEAGPF
jgi:hypothetical protein